jgi:hypothetical protein
MAPFFDSAHRVEPDVDTLDLLGTLSQALLAFITVVFLVVTWTGPDTDKSLFSSAVLWLMATPATVWTGWFVYYMLRGRNSAE